MSSEFTPDVKHYKNFLINGRDVDKIYKALEKDDLSESVVTTMNALKYVSQSDGKSEHSSELCRVQGNEFYSTRRFRPAIECYNQALLYAPKYSEEIKLAYSNRSALLFHIKAYDACIKDIETYFSMGRPNYEHLERSERLRQRKSECLKHFLKEDSEIAGKKFAQKLFKLDSTHPQISSASDNVDIVKESGLPKIVAARNIPVGRVVAVEQPFASVLDITNSRISCHYCHKLSLNLHPCDGCTVALFCDEECRNNCIKDYHEIECKIISIQHFIHYRYVDLPGAALAIRAALKMKQMCKSWREFVKESSNIGECRMRTSSIREVYDVESEFSLLSHKETDQFVHGKRFNMSFTFGMMLRDLVNLPEFFPKGTKGRDDSIRAFARIMMDLYISYRKIEMINATKDVCSESINTNVEANFGWFSFAGKLRHSCNANLLVLCVKNKIGLIAVQPIKKGEELTISFLGHFFEEIPMSRQFKLYSDAQEICHCRVCVEKWNMLNVRNINLTANQLRVHQRLSSYVANQWDAGKRDKSVFKAACEGLTALQGTECSKEYNNMFLLFRKLTSYYQFVAANNKYIQKSHDGSKIFLP